MIPKSLWQPFSAEEVDGPWRSSVVPLCGSSSVVAPRLPQFSAPRRGGVQMQPLGGGSSGGGSFSREPPRPLLPRPQAQTPVLPPTDGGCGLPAIIGHLGRTSAMTRSSCCAASGMGTSHLLWLAATQISLAQASTIWGAMVSLGGTASEVCRTSCSWDRVMLPPLVAKSGWL
jgi:hypothetical protein